MTRRVTIHWGAMLLNLEFAACAGGPMPRVLWQHFYKARDHWVCKWVREQPKGFFQEQRELQRKKTASEPSMSSTQNGQQKNTGRLSPVISAATAEPCNDETDIANARSLRSSLGMWLFMHVEHA